MFNVAVIALSSDSSEFSLKLSQPDKVFCKLSQFLQVVFSNKSQLVPCSFFTIILSVLNQYCVKYCHILVTSHWGWIDNGIY
jgi:hypothetical protein